MKNKRRIEAWDFLKSLAIFLVVWGHCLRYMVDGNPFEIEIYAWMKSFHMPLFMVLAGLFAVKGFKRDSLRVFFKKRGQRLLLPAMSWGLIIYAVDVYLWNDLSLGIFLKDVLYESLWFLKCLFACGLLGLVAFKPQSHRKCWVTLSLLISQFIPFWNISVMYPCFVFGMVITRYLDVFLKHKTLTLGISGIVFVILSLYMAFTPSFWIMTRGVKAALFNGELLTIENLSLIGSILFRNYGQIISGVSGSMLLVIGSYVLAEKFTMPKAFSKIADMGKYTMGVYLIQTIVIEMLLTRVISVEHESSTLFIYIYSPLLAFVTVWASLMLTKYICEQFSFMAMVLFGETSAPNVKKLAA